MKLVIAKDYKRFGDYLKENNLMRKDAWFAQKGKMATCRAREIVFFADWSQNPDREYLQEHCFARLFCRLRDVK